MISYQLNSVWSNRIKRIHGILAHEELAISLIKHPILPKETFCLHRLILNKPTAHTISYSIFPSPPESFPYPRSYTLLGSQGKCHGNGARAVRGSPCATLLLPFSMTASSL